MSGPARKEQRAKSAAPAVSPEASRLAALQLDYFTEYQRKWIADESPMKLAEKSRRIGWTYATSFRRVYKALTVAGLACWVSTRDLTTAKEFVRDCSLWCRLAGIVASGLAGERVEVIGRDKDGIEITAQVIEFPNQSRIHVLTSNPDALAGKGGDVVIDEFALHKDDERLWQVALPTASVWGYQVEVISTHRGKSTQFARFCADAKAANKMGWSFYSTTIVQACEQGLVDRINSAVVRRGGKPTTVADFLATQRRRCASQEQWDQEYMCIPAESAGALLTYENIAQVELEEHLLTIDPKKVRGPTYAGMDIGRKKDLSVIWVIEDEGAISWTREVRTLEKMRFREQFSMLTNLRAKWGIRRMAIDETGIGAQIAEDAEEDFGQDAVEKVPFTVTSKADMAGLMLRAFQDATVRIPSDSDIREDLHKVQKIVGENGIVRYLAESDEDGHADRFWALALALRAKGRAPMFADGLRVAREEAANGWHTHAEEDDELVAGYKEGLW